MVREAQDDRTFGVAQFAIAERQYAQDEQCLRHWAELREWQSVLPSEDFLSLQKFEVLPEQVAKL